MPQIKRENIHFEYFSRDKPGSPEAERRGCSCPAAKNNFGRADSFVSDAECIVHGIDVAIRMLEDNSDSDDGTH